jgi:integrase
MKIVLHENGYYYARLKGKKNPIGLRTKSLSEAKSRAKEMKLEEMESADRIGILSGAAMQIIRSGKRITVDNAIASYVDAMRVDGYAITSIMRDELRLKQWASDMKIGGLMVSAIERKHIDDHVNVVNDTKWTTRKRNLAAIQGFYRFCLHSGWTFENVAAQVSVRRDTLTQAQLLPKEISPFTEEEIRLILSNLEPGSFWHVAVLLGWYCGLRMGDICKLEHASIRGNMLRIVTGKAGTEVLHELPEEALRSLAAVVPEGGRHKIYVFPDRAEQTDAPYGKSALSHQFARLCERLGLEGRHFHALRHSFALRRKAQEKRKIFLEMLEQLSDKSVMDALGHKALASTKVYLNHGKAPMP